MTEENAVNLGSIVNCVLEKLKELKLFEGSVALLQFKNNMPELADVKRKYGAAYITTFPDNPNIVYMIFGAKAEAVNQYIIERTGQLLQNEYRGLHIVPKVVPASRSNPKELFEALKSAKIYLNELTSWIKPAKPF